MTSFKRAHSPQQREERRRVILDTAAAMLAEMPVVEVTLNELSRRVGLAKSNVLRYFESREAVLLELATAASSEWLAGLGEVLSVAIETTAAPAHRADALADTLAVSLAQRPVLCDLISTQAAVLERNISTDTVVTYKHAAIANATALAELVEHYLPELGEYGAGRFVAAGIMMTGAVWTHSHPTAAVREAYEADPALAGYELDFTTAVREAFEVLLAGLLVRASH